MTYPDSSLDAIGAIGDRAEFLPAATTPVLQNRPLNPVVGAHHSSVFGDDIWRLEAGIFEAHMPYLALNFRHVPARLRTIAKIYFWTLINDEEAPPRRRWTTQYVRRLAIGSMPQEFYLINPFFRWLDDRPDKPLDALTAEDFDDYLATLLAEPLTMRHRAARLHAVQRLWGYRERLPLMCRLPVTLPWDGEFPSNLLGSIPRRSPENATARISAEVMQPLLGWSVRFIEDFSPDILDAYQEYRLICNRHYRARGKGLSPSLPRHTPEMIKEIILDLLDRYAKIGRPLPGRRRSTGELVVHELQLCRQLNCSHGALKNRREWLAEQIAQRGLTLVEGAPVHDQVKGRLDGAPWRSTRITYRESHTLARHLSTAAFIIICYLSGMRVGEALNLERGCAQHDPDTVLDYVYGRTFKDIRELDGTKAVAGVKRRTPWTVIPLVIKAITTLESLHDAQWLFPSSLQTNGRLAAMRGQGKQARTGLLLGNDIHDFIAWVNSYCDQHGRSDRIPPDPDGLYIAPSRFRRTLAWFIWRRPRGPVAAAIQYGHIHVNITQGYAGSAASGFPSDLAFEEFLARAEQAQEDERRLQEGERVSGPAADAYRDRTVRATAHFAGHTYPTKRQAVAALNTPDLQVFHGRAMTCVFDRTKSLCELRAWGDDPRRTPDLEDCYAACQNIARTDRDIQQVRLQLEELQTDADDPLAPEPRRIRAQTLVSRTQAIIEAHDMAAPMPSRPSRPSRPTRERVL